MREGERILVLSSTFPQYPGDPRGAFIHRHWERAGAAGHRVRVLVPHTAWSHGELEGRMEIHRYAYAPKTWSSLTGHFGILENIRERPWRVALLPFYLRSTRRALERELKAFRPDRVVAHMVFPCGKIVGERCRAEGIPYEIYGHGSDLDLLIRVHAVLGGDWGWLRGAERLTVPSAEKRQRLWASLGSVLGPLPIEIEAMRHCVRAPAKASNLVAVKNGRLLYMGRLIRQKGVDLLLRALSMMSAPPPIDIAGDGPERRRLEGLAARLGVDAHFHGFVQGETRETLYAGAAALCVPSRERGGFSEGAPLVIVEAQRYGLLVVASRVGGIPELCTEGRSILVRAEEPRAWAEALSLATLTTATMDDDVVGERCG